MESYRYALVTDHGAAHRVDCPKAAKLKGPVRVTAVFPFEHHYLRAVFLEGPGEERVFPAKCCIRWFRTKKEIRTAWVWQDDNEERNDNDE